MATVVKLSPKIIKLNSPQSLPDGVVVSVETVDPSTAAKWIQCNKLNRPTRKSHILFLAREITSGLWQLNGQPIVVSIDEDVLDGQHRLLAIIEAGVPVRTLVVYGITKEAFKTMDTGIVRTGADALSVYFHDKMPGHVKAVGTAVPLCYALEKKSASVGGGRGRKLANAEIIDYVTRHPSLWDCAAVIGGYPASQRLLSLGLTTGLFEMFRRKDPDLADNFMRRFCTGELLKLTEPEAVLRDLLHKDAKRVSHYPSTVKVRMVVKAWNLCRRNRMNTTPRAISVNPAQEGPETIIL